MRIPFLFFTVCTLAGCASDAMRHCSTVAGAGWTRSAQPPPNAGALLAMQSLPDEADALWFAKGDDQVVACIYARSLTNPGCGAATVYQYAKVDNRWVSRGTAMEACAPDF